MTPGITIRSAGSADAEGLLKLSEASPGAPAWKPQTWHSVLASAVSGAQRIVLVAEADNQLVGFGVLGRAHDSAEIESLAVTTAWRRRGLGREICDQLLAWARDHGATQAFLEVRVSNSAAQSLYKSLGFQESGIRRGYYQQPDEDALVMTLAL
jgi:ribosomal-protein-alanine acetyltransferase